MALVGGPEREAASTVSQGTMAELRRSVSTAELDERALANIKEGVWV